MVIENKLIQFKRITNKYMKQNNFGDALNMISLVASINSSYNQVYSDFELENMLLQIGDEIIEKRDITSTNKNVVLFYDGFGNDLRGWAVSYIRALSKLKYNVLYVTTKKSKHQIPHIISELDCNLSKVFYIDIDREYLSGINELNMIFNHYKPCTAFLYTKPNDVVGTLVFSQNKWCKRIQIDLTDHAYWLGVNAFDYILDCREMGASISHYYRKIPLNRIIKLDCSPYILRDRNDKPLPFNILTTKYVFTGGALYKTLGDNDLLYYKTIAYILEKYQDIVFLYAGSGNDSEIQKLQYKFPNRVFLINERPDFFYILSNCILYINSYPMFGGLMMRYAALANKIPITLKHNNDSDGLLINQSQLGIEYDDYNEYLSEIDRLLSDDNYRQMKEILISNAVINEKTFMLNLKLLIEENKTQFSFVDLTCFDTKKFREEYKNRYLKSNFYKNVASRNNIKIAKNFPISFILGVLLKMKERMT